MARRLELFKQNEYFQYIFRKFTLLYKISEILLPVKLRITGFYCKKKSQINPSSECFSIIKSTTTHKANVILLSSYTSKRVIA